MIGHVGKLAWVAQAIAWRGAFCFLAIPQITMDWSKLNKHQLGKYGEYYAKMEFAKYGFDIYSTEVDDKGIDFVIRNEKGDFFEIQVKSIRWKSAVFMKKDVFRPRANLYLALLVFGETEISFALIPSLEWRRVNRQVFLVDRNYEGKKSAPEFGINISAQSLVAIKDSYSFSKMLPSLVVEKPVVKKRAKVLQHT